MLHFSTGGVDYNFLPQNLTFNDASTTVCVSIMIVDDSLLELAESFTVQLDAFQTNVMLATDRATVNIADNDGELYCS